MEIVIEQINRKCTSLGEDYQAVKKKKEQTAKALKNQEAAVEKLRRAKSKLNDEIMLSKTKNTAAKGEIDQKTRKLAQLKKKAENAQKELDHFKELRP